MENSSDTGFGLSEAGGGPEDPQETPTKPESPDWDASVGVSTLPVSLSFGTLESSSRLKVNWQFADDALAYEVTAQFGEHEVRKVVDADTRRVVLTGLRSDTTYEIMVSACEDEDCWRSTSSSLVSGTTGAMAWLIMGEGSSFNTATPIIEDSDTKGYGLFYGSDAPTGMAGTIQLYYDSNRVDRKGVNVATSVEGEEGMSDMVAYEMVESYGLQRDQSVNGAAKGPSTHQAVPMTGGGIRLFFEGQLHGDDESRLYHIDSQDGDRGHDFHPGTDTSCRAEDIVEGGDCAPVVALGGEVDGNLGVASIRQSKLVYPMFDNWRWDQSRDSVMLTTLHLTEEARQCSGTHFNMGLARWNGLEWDLSYDSDTGCPQVFQGIQSPMPVHMGDGRYMVLFNANTGSSTDVATNKPLYVMYADAAATGDPDLLEWSDFEDRADAREVVTYWPSGIELPDVMERKLDDFGVFSPSGEQDNLVMYANMSCSDGSCVPFIGQLGWVNP